MFFSIDYECISKNFRKRLYQKGADVTSALDQVVDGFENHNGMFQIVITHGFFEFDI